MESDGSPCRKCTKCFRRDVIRVYLDEKYVPNWETYENEKIKVFLQKRPLYFGHIFATAFYLRPDSYPSWILDEVKSLRKINLDWLMKVYAPSFELCSPRWRDYISSRVLEFIQPMNEAEILEFKSWNQV